MIKFKNLEIKSKNKCNKFLQDDPDVDMKLKAGRENESVGIEEVTPDFSNFF